MQSLTDSPRDSLLPALSRTIDDWREVLELQGEPSFRAVQVFRWLHRRGEFDPAMMTDLGLGLREHLRASGVAEPGRVIRVHRSEDGTKKLLIEFDGSTRVECVLIPMTKASEQDADAAAVDLEQDADAAAVDLEQDADAAAVDLEQDADAVRGDAFQAAVGVTERQRRKGRQIARLKGRGAQYLAGAGEAGAGLERQRLTLCLSTQFGCAMGCVFCASGRAGLKRGLVASEVVAQVLLSRRYLEPNQDLRNLVFMGMGEPLHHYEETARAIRLLTHPDGQNLSPRRITVSTVGLAPKIRRLGQDFGGKVGLAVSLHAPSDALRDRLLPVNRHYPLAELLHALRHYPLPRRRRITIEYTLIAGQNDQDHHASELADLLRGLPVKVNLIPMNPVIGSEFQAPSNQRIVRFQELLAGRGYSCFVRTRRGDDVAAACGQLAMADGLVTLRTARERAGG